MEKSIKNVEKKDNMINGIGTDICDINRIKDFSSLAEKILTKEEKSLFANKKTELLKKSFLAKRFAGKEAVSKAFGLGIGSKIGFKDISILNNKEGKPYVIISEKAKIKLPTFKTVHISLSDEKNFVTAFAIVEN